jgi:hypothetical protein
LVGQAGFEPTAPTTPRWCATKLRYCPLMSDNKRYFIISLRGRQVIIMIKINLIQPFFTDKGIVLYSKALFEVFKTPRIETPS